jgi:hypothetical protein
MTSRTARSLLACLFLAIATEARAQDAPSGTAVSISFAVTGIDPTTLDQVFVRGDRQELGSWQGPGLELVPPRDASSNVWTSKVGSIVLAPGPLQLKLVRIDLSGTVTWQSGDNRTVTIPSATTCQISLGWTDTVPTVTAGTPVPPPSSPVQVTFAVTGINADAHDQVFVRGDVPELGSWQGPGLELVAPVGSTTWTAKVGPIVLKSGTVLHFKVMRIGLTGSQVWQDGDNRTATIPSIPSCRIALDWNDATPSVGAPPPPPPPASASRSRGIAGAVVGPP